MGSLLIDIASAVVTELNLSALEPAFTAARHYRPLFELAELKTLRVSVVPRGITIASLGRNLNQHDVAIDVAIQQKVDPADTPSLDRLMQLVQDVADFLRLRRLSAFPPAVWAKTENVPVYALEHLEQQRVFTSVLTITYRVVR